MSEEWIVENTWVCSSCQEKNLGRHMKCQKCGSPKEKDEKDIVPDPSSTKTVVDPELLRLANEAANWVCSYCGGQVRDEYGKCRNCAAPKEEAEDHTETVAIQSVDLNMWSDPGWDQVKRDSQSTVQMRPPRRAEVKTDWSPFFWLVAITVGIGLLAWFFIWFFAPKELSSTVKSTMWKYTALVRQRTIEYGNGWGSPRADAFNVSCQNKYYGDENCHPHDCNPHQVAYDCRCHSYQCNPTTSCTDLKNGFSRCTKSYDTCSKCDTCYRTVYSTCYDQCPVYRNWCEYQYYDWPVLEKKETTGADDNVAWPDLSAVGPYQRLERYEDYNVVFVRGGDTWKYSPKSLDEFKRYRSGASWVIRVRRLGLFTEPLREM